MDKDLRLSKVLQIVLLAIILILVSLYVPMLSFLLVIVPILFSIIGTLSNIKNNIISLITIFFILIISTKLTYLMDVFINSIIPGLVIGIVTKKILKDNSDDKYKPIFVGTIVFMFSTVIYYTLSKLIFNTDLLQNLLNVINESLNMQSKIFNTTSNEIINTTDISSTIRNLIPSILFVRSMILSIVVYLVEVLVLKKMNCKNLSQVKFTNFYLPGNAILISFILYLLMMVLSTMDTPLYADAIFLNLQTVFNFMFIIQGISVSIYFIKKWIKQGINIKLVLGALCIGLFGIMSISFVGMVDSILDFRKVRVCKSI